MKRTLLTFVILWQFTGFVIAQNDYIQYYQLINKAKDYADIKQNDSAVVLLK